MRKALACCCDNGVISNGRYWVMRTTKAERKRRREAALARVADGYGFSDVVTFMMAQWGCSRSTAQRDCGWAHTQLAASLKGADINHLVAHLCTSAQRVALKAEQAGQFAAAIGALKLLHEMLVIPHNNPKERFVRRGLRCSMA